MTRMTLPRWRAKTAARRHRTTKLWSTVRHVRQLRPIDRSDCRDCSFGQRRRRGPAGRAEDARCGRCWTAVSAPVRVVDQIGRATHRMRRQRDDIGNGTGVEQWKRNQPDKLESTGCVVVTGSEPTGRPRCRHADRDCAICAQASAYRRAIRCVLSAFVGPFCHRERGRRPRALANGWFPKFWSHSPKAFATLVLDPTAHPPVCSRLTPA